MPKRNKARRAKFHVRHARKVVKRHVEKHVAVSPKAPLIEKMPDERAFDLLKRYRIPTVIQAFCKNEKDLPECFKKINFPCVMKVSGNRIIHKTEFNGIRTNIQNLEQAMQTFRELMKIKNAEKVLIQKQLHGIEMIVGAKQNGSFGHVITSGIGGIYTEILKDVTFRIAPLGLQDAEEMIRELKGIEILKGSRTGKPINFSSLYETLMRLSKLATSEKIKEMDINPLFCNENGCFAVDVRIIK